MKNNHSFILEIIQKLSLNYPNAKCSLNYNSPFQLLVSVILSAQCTDIRVNLVTKNLFSKYPDVNSFYFLKQENLEKIIYSTGFYKNKARNILSTSKMLVEKFNKSVPSNMKDLLKLPGVARKTANVILSEIFHSPEGIVVDTHVSRISQRLNLTKETNPIKIEKNLMSLIPKNQWISFSHYLIYHGRKLCKARNPICKNCFLIKLCPYYKHLKTSSLLFLNKSIS